jgi:hypothetical protein
MAIPVGFFDFYSFMLPGVLYLYVFNEAARILNIGHFDLFLLKDNLWLGVGILLFAYIVGHIMNELSFHWFRLLRIRRGSQYAYDEFKKRRVPDVNFNHQSWTVLLGVIRRNNPDVAQKIDLHLVNSIMFRNIGLAFALFFITEIISIILTGWLTITVFLAVLWLIACLISIRQSVNYDRWFFEAVFEHAVTFGKTTNKVINALSEKPATKKNKKTA